MNVVVSDVFGSGGGIIAAVVVCTKLSLSLNTSVIHSLTATVL